MATNAFDLTCNPYKDSACTTSPAQPSSFNSSAVCGIKYSDASCSQYSLQSFRTAASAKAAGYKVTHTGVCGACSSTKDLSVYMSLFDMTSVGKKCGERGIVDEKLGQKCFMDLGMTKVNGKKGLGFGLG